MAQALHPPLEADETPPPVETIAAPAGADTPPHAAPRPPRRRIWRRLRLGILSLLLAGAVLAEASLLTGPNVEAVPAAVAAIDRAHAAVPVMVSPTDRIALAMVAVENDSYYSDNGIDGPALLRGLWGFVTGSDAGGSTIEIQLAHLAFPGQTESLWGRVHRVTLALQFDTHFSKPAILSMYLDAAYYGHGFYGIRAASLGYFGVPPAQLSWAQAATLAGLVQAPSQLDPFVNPGAALARRGYVLQRLVATGMLSQTQADASGRSPLGVVGAASSRMS